jgi:hypothetical protein
MVKKQKQEKNIMPNTLEGQLEARQQILLAWIPRRILKRMEDQSLQPNSKANCELCRSIIHYQSNAEQRKHGWEKLLNQNPSNGILVHVVKSVADDEIKNQAGEILLSQNPWLFDFSAILDYCIDAGLLKRAEKKFSETKFTNKILMHSYPGDFLSKNRQIICERVFIQNPTKSDLTFVITECWDNELRSRAGKQLRKKLGIKEFDEEGLIKKIAEKVLINPSDLLMGNRHDGTAHRLDECACVLDNTARSIEQKYGIGEGTTMAGAAVLPSYAHLFDMLFHEVILDVLKNPEIIKDNEAILALQSQAMDKSKGK